MKILAQASTIRTKSKTITLHTTRKSDQGISKAENLDQEVSLLKNVEYDVPATVPSAPYYALDPAIYKSYHWSSCFHHYTYISYRKSDRTSIKSFHFIGNICKLQRQKKFLRKLWIPHEKARFNEIFIKGSRPYIVYQKHAEKVLIKHHTLVIHAMTAAINKAVQLYLFLRRKYPYLHA